jgi:hypothetical protein
MTYRNAAQPCAATMRARRPRYHLVSILACLLAACALLASCSGGGGIDPLVPPPQPSEFVAILHGGSLVRIHSAGSGLNAGTAVTVTGAATGAGEVTGTGHLSFDTQLTGAPDGQVVVHYEDLGVQFSTPVEITTLAGRVTAPLFSTGAGPNDMEYGNGSLYIANSMDNTVVRYGLDGAVLATAQFPESSSPSYVTLSEGKLWVVRNGDNTVTALDADNLAELPGQDYAIDGGGAAFTGPSKPAVLGGEVFVPRNQVATFAPTTYGTGMVSVLNGGSQSEFATTGLNPQFAAFEEATGMLYVTCSGDIQFDENFMPFPASDSYLERFPRGDTGVAAALNLGEIGAGRIALAGNAAYIGNSLSGNLYKADLEQWAVERGEGNPIALTSEFTFISDVAVVQGGDYLLATSFNTDELYVISTADDSVNPGPYPEPFDLALDPELLAGAANVEVAPDPQRPGHYAAYVLYGVGNAVAKVELF